jgi:hypothetical protein
MTFLITSYLICSAMTSYAAVAPPRGSAEQKQADGDDSLDNSPDEGAEIIVTAPRSPGRVVTPHEPILVLDKKTIRILGVASLEKLLERVGPAAQGPGGSAPVLLLNGRRIGSEGEIDSLPPEAIEQMEILPEPVAAQFGYPPTSRVVNIITARHFTSLEGNSSTAQPTIGRGTEIEVSGSGTLLRRDLRSFVSARWQDKAGIAAERPSPAVATSGALQGGFGEVLRPAESMLRFEGSLAGPIGKDLNASLAINLQQDDQTSYASGIDSPLFGEAEPAHDTTPRLRLHARTTALQATGMFQWFLDRWSWNTTLSARKANFRQTFASPAEVNSAPSRSTSTAGEIAVSATGPIMLLSGGWAYATATLKAGRETATSTEDSGSSNRKVQRGTAAFKLALSVPVTSPDNLGIMFDASAEASSVSGQGRLTSWTAGLSASPITGLHLSANHARRSSAPTLDQAAGAVSVVPGTPYFDRVAGRDVLVDLISGGNSALQAEQEETLDLGFELQPFAQQQLRFGAVYSNIAIKHNIAIVGASDLALEAAFPALFKRDAAGKLISVSSIPVNLRSRRQQAIKWSLSYSGDLRTANFSEEPPGTAARAPLFALVDLDGTIRLRDRITLVPGLPPLDLLDGAVFDSTRGQSRLEISALVSLNSLHWGADVSGRWQASTRLASDNPDSDLAFGSLLTFRLSTFYNLEALGSEVWMRALRLELAADNIFGAKQQVRDRNGRTPESLTPARLDPRGPTLTISLRKLF